MTGKKKYFFSNKQLYSHNISENTGVLNCKNFAKNPENTIMGVGSPYTSALNFRGANSMCLSCFRIY